MSYRRNSYRSSLTDTDVSNIRLQAMSGYNESEIAEINGVHRKTVYNILQNRTWKHVPEPRTPYGFKDYLVFPDGRVYSQRSRDFISTSSRADGTPVVRVQRSGGNRVTVPVASLVARAYHGSRSDSPNISYADGNPSNTHFTNIEVQ